MSFLDDLVALAPHTVIATPMTLDEDGDETDGTPVNLTKCHISQKNRLTRDTTGAEVVSSAKIISLENKSLDNNYRFTLPSDYPAPRVKIKPISVKLVSDESGPLYEVIMLP